MDAEDNQAPALEQPVPVEPIESSPAEGQPVTDQPIESVPVYEPSSSTESQVFILSDEQFTQLRDLGVYQVAGIWALIGMLVIIAFWVGWRSTK